jgi:hypothetical protein
VGESHSLGYEPYDSEVVGSTTSRSRPPLLVAVLQLAHGNQGQTHDKTAARAEGLRNIRRRTDLVDQAFHDGMDGALQAG